MRVTFIKVLYVLFKWLIVNPRRYTAWIGTNTGAQQRGEKNDFNSINGKNYILARSLRIAGSL